MEGIAGRIALDLEIRVHKASTKVQSQLRQTGDKNISHDILHGRIEYVCDKTGPPTRPERMS